MIRPQQCARDLAPIRAGSWGHGVHRVPCPHWILGDFYSLLPEPRPALLNTCLNGELTTPIQRWPFLLLGARAALGGLPAGPIFLTCCALQGSH